MGKKPVLGMVSALCVGLALTGCRDAATRSDGPVTKGPLYKPQGEFSTNAGNTTTNTASPSAGWNTSPTTAGRNGEWMGGAQAHVPTTAGASMDPAGMNAGRTTPGVQTTGLTAPPAPPSPPPSDYDAPPARMSVQTPTDESHFPPPPGAVHSIPAPSARVLQPPPSFTGPGIAAHAAGRAGPGEAGRGQRHAGRAAAAPVPRRRPPTRRRRSRRRRPRRLRRRTSRVRTCRRRLRRPCQDRTADRSANHATGRET